MYEPVAEHFRFFGFGKKTFDVDALLDGEKQGETL
jgi:hypothetical protein